MFLLVFTSKTQESEVIMLNDLVNSIFGSLPAEFEFLKIYGYLFILYIFVSIFKLFIDVCKEFLKW